jgi:hypothetical protein
MSDLDSRNAGLGGQALPPGGNYNEWQAGNAIRQLNQAEQARQAAFGMPQPTAWEAPKVPFVPVQYNWVVGGHGLNGNPILSIVGLVLLVVVGLPLIQYSIPLWFAFYPLAAAATAVVYAGTFMGLKEMIFAAVAAFVAAWPLTLVDQAMAKNKGYWILRHTARLFLLFIWAIYALSLRELKIAHIPDITRSGMPQLIFSPMHIGLALLLVAVMHFWLSKFKTWG